MVENRLWGDALQGNAYFASLLLALSMFAGAALGERSMLVELDSSFMALNGVTLVGLLVILSGFLLCESVCVGKSLDVIIIRTIAVQLALALAAVLGYLLGWPLLLLSIAWILALLAFVFLDLKRY